MLLDEKSAILPGGIVPRSARMLTYMIENVPGVTVPKSYIDRMSETQDPKGEGIKIAIELVNDLKSLDGIRGVHIQAIEWESAVREITSGTGLLPRPEVVDAG